ncbi:MAG: cyclic nucleotide-binding domain-containing protein [Pirellula sp.]|nr:cyclic nucleotide-binding domain-containing protein [Pirellula sp.]
MKDLIEQVHGTMLALYLGDHYLVEFVSKGMIQFSEPHELLFKEGDFNESTYIVVKGQVELYMTVPGRGESRILSLGRGDLVAWSSITGDAIMTCSARCLQPTILLRWKSQEIHDQMQSDNEFGFRFMKLISSVLAKRLVATRLQLLDLFYVPSQRR